MNIVIECDGHANTESEMSIGVIIKDAQRLRGGKVLQQISRLMGTGTAPGTGSAHQAEYLAVLEGLKLMKDRLIIHGDVLHCQAIVVLTDNQGVKDEILGIHKVNSPQLWALNQEIQQLRVFFEENRIPLTFRRGETTGTILQ